ncbi:ZEB2-regulated ABC transporter 1 [Lachnellula arida]|uniref:ZEB2-regulated ABC transporter 1 n=1 Tax=Lachnellula arida TaxID=1316785 RepID=A0A8T9BJM4_9HELO|nr:ZEB2-regulated ABC transporter 1 [Lachnellula arida]
MELEVCLNPFRAVPAGSPLDPASESFSAKKWLSNLIGFVAKDPEKYPYRFTGLTFRDLDAYGFRLHSDYQKTVGNIFLEVGHLFRSLVGTGKQKVQILKGFDGIVENGQMLLVLGRPGSGCSTLLKTISGDTDGFHVDEHSQLNYQGISAQQMHTQFRGEAIYMAENDVHFPQLTVGQTLLFAAKARAPRDYTFPEVTRDMYATHMRDVIMATFGLRHTLDTNVGNDIMPGVSGGERKRVSIAEAALSGSPLQCWDNSTRGLDSANALEFCKHLRISADMAGSTVLVSLYQGSQEAYDLFDKVTVLYAGRQIFFGPSKAAKAYFINMGFACAPRQTTADFLTSLTSPSERSIRPGFENRTPRTAAEFVTVWQRSTEYAQLLEDIAAYNEKYPIGGRSAADFAASRSLQQAKHQRVKSPYTLSVDQQIKLCVERGFQRLKGDASITISGIVANSIMALVVGSIFYNMQDSTADFYSRSVLLFFAILLNAFASALEIIILFDQRPIVEKHARYALYHPFTEAISSALCDLPYKICNSIAFNLVLYFMTNLRRTPEAFFVFITFSFFTTLSLSMVFRTIGATSRSLAQALAPGAIFILALMVYTGFVIPVPNMVPWFRWINKVNPIAYAFESLMINEFHGRNFKCGAFVPQGPQYGNAGDLNRICSTVGAQIGSDFVSGTDFIRLSYNYERSHMWRNFAIIVAFFVFFTGTYLTATEFITEKKSKGEVLIFQRTHRPRLTNANDPEKPQTPPGTLDPMTRDLPSRISGIIEHQTSTFHWRDICYDIKTKKENRRILDHVDGWVKPRSLTALMGPSGAGKTTLLDVLAARDTIGVASGGALVDGHQRDISFQRKTGYAQQQDIHLETMTVREALQFNALMCQPQSLEKKEKLAYVEEVIKLLKMESYANAIIGPPGEGLNIEQRKKLTIAVELAARPQLLLFLDEPSSGLDSQTAWAVLDLLQQLTAHGQAILCTIHQPSAMLFQRFDRLLLLAPEGKPVYFGQIGYEASTVISYFERNGAKPCHADANPAEWIMEALGCAPGHQSTIDWPEVWRASPEYVHVHHELDEMEKQDLRSSAIASAGIDEYQEYAASFRVQLWECLKRVNKQYWRSPSYIYSKTALCALASVFLGFSFYKADNSLQGLQSQTFSIFMLLTQSSNLVPQILPNFCIQRSLYERRERPAKTYSWKVFILSNILVELPWNTLMSFILFVSWYYPIGLYRNAEPSHAVVERGVTMFLLMWVYMMYTSTFAHMVQAGVELAGMAGNYANLLFILTLIFSGLLVNADALPGFWIFMYRVSPFTYLISGILSVGLANAPVSCSKIELLHFDPLPGMKCGSYLKSYVENAGGRVINPDATSACSFCQVDNTNDFLKSLRIYYDDRWRNFGILWIYVIFNVCAAVFLYWMFRLPKKIKKGTPQNISDPPLPQSEHHDKVELDADLDEEELRQAILKMRLMVDDGKFVGSMSSKLSGNTEEADCEL